HLWGYEFLPDDYTHRVPPDTIRCAKDILERLRAANHAAFKGKSLVWSDKHLRYGLPTTPNTFDYEKDIIRFYIAKQCYELIDRDPAKEPDLRRTHQAALDAWPREKVKKTLDKGIVADWPAVYRYEPRDDNPLRTDAFRSEQGESLVRAAALVGLDAPGHPLAFPEAGPRPKLALPSHPQLKVAIVVAGGIAPGINAVIDAIVQRHEAYHRASGQDYQLAILGLKNGLLAIERQGGGIQDHSRPLMPAATVEHATRGGSMIGTSRDEDLLHADPKKRAERTERIADELLGREIDVLYIIGGDGSMQAAHVLWHKANALSNDPLRPRRTSRVPRMSVVAIPKTMDNDILWVWQSFGFLSAVEEAREIVERLHTEVRSNPRLGIVQFFGSGSGFVVSHAVLAAATGHTALALIPEMDFSVIGLARYLKRRLWEARRQSNTDRDLTDPAAPIDPSIPHGLIVMAETAIPLDAMECLGLERPPPGLERFYEAVAKQVKPTDDEKKAIHAFLEKGRRVQGQTSEHLRNLGIKILHEALPILIKDRELNGLMKDKPGCEEPDWDKLRMVRNEPRYLVRALEPSTSDIINGQRLGLLAVDAAMAGYTDCMISQWLTEFTIVPLDLVVLGRKRIPPTGMFWNSVAAKTRQPADLVSPFPRARPPSPEPR
ncbi:MAG TPA: 6-phosphofructokinase, partial [Gemmataceae bacterium]|nr:6-phosphofructokinase [Gemmataceae bacterium]